MKQNIGIQNLNKLTLEKIGERAAFSQKEKKVVEVKLKKKPIQIYPHQELLDLMRSSKKKGKLAVSVSSYFILAAMEKLVRDGYEKELRERGLL